MGLQPLVSLCSLEAAVSYIETLSKASLVKNALLLILKGWNYCSVPPRWDSCSLLKEFQK